MKNHSFESLQEEQQNVPQKEQIQQEEICQDKQDDQETQVEGEKSKKRKNFESFFGKFSGATLGVVSIFFTIGFVVFLAWGIVTLLEMGYDHWFGDLHGRNIGQNELVYVETDNTIYKTSPNRKILTQVTSLVEVNDSIGIVCYQGKNGILDLNTTKFLLPAQYEMIWASSPNVCYAVKQDTVFTILLPEAKIVKRELTTTFYCDIRPIYRDNDYDYYYYGEDGEEDAVLLYEYTDYTGRCGMMSKDLKKLTLACYSHIEAVIGKKDVFLCRFDESDASEEDEYKGIGELRNAKGEKIE